jgi:hypothetical protein
VRYPRRGRRGGAAGVQESLFDVDRHPERRYYRQILDALGRSDFGADAFAAELVVSRLCGTVWAAQEGRRDGATEEAFGLGLVEFARTYRTPTTVAVLRTLAVVAPIREVRLHAAQAADALAADGLPDPRWSPPAGAVTPGRCWAYEDVYGDESTVICEYGYGPDLRRAERHAIMVRVDHVTYSVAAGAQLSREVDAVVRDLRNEAKTCAPMFTLRQVEPAWARAVLERALARTDLIDTVAVGPGLDELRALFLGRINVLPTAPGVLAPESAPPTAAARAALVADFIGSPEARGLPDPAMAARVADLILDFSGDRDPGQPLRVSPTTWDMFVWEWLPVAAPTVGGDHATLRAVLGAWSRWAARRLTLPDVAQDELIRALDETLAAVPRPERAAATLRT